jgi:hypothetical protein
MAKVQVPAKASVDESLQAAKGLARIGMAKVINPSPYRLIHLLNKLGGRDRRPPLGEVLDPSSNVALRGPTTERYLGCKQRFHDAVNDHIGLEPDAAS